MMAHQSTPSMLSILEDEDKAAKLRSQIVSEFVGKQNLKKGAKPITEIMIERAIEDIHDRLKWKVDSLCTIYSEPEEMFIEGIISEISIDDENEQWITVKFQVDKSKKLKRFSGGIRVFRVEKDEEYIFSQKLMDDVIEKLKEMVAEDSMYTVIYDEDNKELLNLRTITHLVANSPLITKMGIPPPISALISEYSLSEMRLLIDKSMVDSISCDSYSSYYDIDRLFSDNGVYCTSSATDCEMVIRLSTQNHRKKQGQIGGDDADFVITEVGIKAPGWGFTAPIETMLMWTFHGSKSVPDKNEMKKRFGGQTMVKEGDVYDPEKDKGLSDKELAEKCMVHIGIDRGTEKKCDLLPGTVVGAKWVKATHVLLKLQNSPQRPNVDAEYFWIKVLPL